METASLFGLILFTIAAALIVALLEIQIEGSAGWAKNLPTWRRRINLFGLLDKELTGYHLFSMLMWFTLPHFGLIFGGWTIHKELILIAYFLAFLVLEDFLWFVFNPAFGISKFKSQFIPWHKKWFLGLPLEYWIVFPLVLILLALGLS